MDWINAAIAYEMKAQRPPSVVLDPSIPSRRIPIAAPKLCRVHRLADADRDLMTKKHRGSAAVSHPIDQREAIKHQPRVRGDLLCR
eukprot:scaffold1074_cov192-Pinguiococcus_pyrenoidosus.AAC.2